jgi:hypothetical protein
MKKRYVKPAMRRFEPVDPVRRFAEVSTVNDNDSESMELQPGAATQRETDCLGAVAQASNRRRSERVVLRMPILLRAMMSDGNRAQVQGFTLVVNAHGGLLQSTLSVAVNQRIALLHPQSDQQVACRVVRTEQVSPEAINVAFEFDEPAAHFWPVSFPPEDWGAVAS